MSSKLCVCRTIFSTFRKQINELKPRISHADLTKHDDQWYNLLNIKARDIAGNEGTVVSEFKIYILFNLNFQ